MTPAKTPWWRRLLTLEPALVKGVVGAVVTIGLIWGIDLTGLGDQLSQTADVLGSIIPVITAWWIRSSVVPKATVVAQAQPDGLVVAGEASTKQTGEVIGIVPPIIEGLPPATAA